MTPHLRLAGLRSVVLLGAHPDDIEIGAGGLLLALGALPGLRVHYVVLTGSAPRQAEARAAAAAFLPGVRLTLSLHELPDGRLPAHWTEAKEIVERVAAAADPDLVVAPDPGDAHQDHRTIAGLVSGAFRRATVLRYEIPKWDGDLSRHNLYLPMDAERARTKVTLLDKCFPSQRARPWWDEEVFLGLARLRGVECRSRYAEAFHCDKAVLTL